jgi:hypothetical protein
MVIQMRAATLSTGKFYSKIKRQQHTTNKQFCFCIIKKTCTKSNKAHRDSRWSSSPRQTFYVNEVNSHHDT